MKRNKEAEMREKLIDFLKSNGYGALTELADRADISREHLARFKAGASMGAKSLMKLGAAMDGSHIEMASKPIDVPVAPTINQALAAELCGLAAVLLSPDFSEQEKGERFVAVVGGYSKALARFRERIEKRSGEVEAGHKIPK